MKIKELVQHRLKKKNKTKITLSSEGIKVKLANKDIDFEKEILDYSRSLREKLVSKYNLKEPIKLKVNYINGRVHRYKNNKPSLNYDGTALRQVMESK